MVTVNAETVNQKKENQVQTNSDEKEGAITDTLAGTQIDSNDQEESEKQELAETQAKIKEHRKEVKQLKELILQISAEKDINIVAQDDFSEHFSELENNLRQIELKIKDLNSSSASYASLIDELSEVKKLCNEEAKAIANARTEVKYQENLAKAEAENEKEKAEKEKAEKEKAEKEKAEKEKAEDKSKVVTRAGETEVADSEALKKAVEDKSVTKIRLTADIKIASNMTRSAAVEIDGQGHTIDVNKKDFFSVKTPKGDVVKWSNVTFKNFSTGESNFMTGTDGSTIIHLHNVNGGSVADAPRRFISSPRSKLIFSGINNIFARGELFMLGGAIVEDNSTLNLIETAHNWSIFWFSAVSGSSDTGDEKLIIGENANVSARMIKPSGAGDYPAIFYAVDTIDVGKNSVLLAHSAKEAVRSDLRKMTFTIREGALMNATSIGDSGRNIIDERAGSVTVKGEPTSEFYTIGKSKDAAINATNITLDSPKRYDIRSSAPKAVAVTSKSDLTIKNTDVGLWKTSNTNFKGPADESYTVSNFHAKGKSAEATSDKGENLPDLAKYPTTSFRRIAGFNSFPELKIDPLTDADKTAAVRVKIGETPGDSFDENGNIVWEDVYAGKDEAEVSLTDTFGEVKKAKTGDRDGYADVPLEKYNEAYKDVTAVAKAKNGRETKEKKVKPVLDITPPKPAVIKLGDKELTSEDKIEVGQNLTSIKGYIPNEIYDNTSTDKLLIKLMFGEKVVATTEVTKEKINEGNVPFEFKELDLYQFPEGTELQIIAQDNAADGTIMIQPEPVGSSPIDGYSELKDKPVTRSAQGNTTPSKDVTYRDATFKAGTKVTLVVPQGSLDLEAPDHLSFGKQELKTGVLTLKPKTVDGRLAVIDDRVVEKTSWSLRVRELSGFGNKDNSLSGLLKYQHGNETLNINGEFNQIDSDKLAADVNEKVYSDVWTDQKSPEGLSLVIPFSKQKPGAYQGALEWNLVEGPGDSIE